MRCHSVFRLNYCLRGFKSLSRNSTLATSVSFNQSQVKNLHCETSIVDLHNNSPRKSNLSSKRLKSWNFHKDPQTVNAKFSNYPTAKYVQVLLPHRAHLKLLPCVQNQFFRHMANASASTEKSHPSKPHQKSPKSSVKEFNFKGKIGDHDLNIKMNKIKGLMEKGKVVQVFLRSQKSGSSKTETMSIAKFQQKLTDSLGSLGKLQKDFSNAVVTKFTLTPIIEKESAETLSKNSPDDSNESSK